MSHSSWSSLPSDGAIATHPHNPHTLYGTTIVSVRRDDQVVIAGDGQVTLGNMVIKHNTNKLRTLAGGKVLAGFAGSTADALVLCSRLETKLEEFGGQLPRACIELARDWRSDRYLRRLEAMLIAADHRNSFLVSGVGDVIEPEDYVMAIGSGGGFALAAARALVQNTTLPADTIAREALGIAGKMCIYTNDRIQLLSLPSHGTPNAAERGTLLPPPSPPSAATDASDSSHGVAS